MTQLAKELHDAVVLLRATLEILKKADEGPYVQNVFELEAHYDGTTCDGLCLMEDIEHYLEMLDERGKDAGTS